jgi:hypothetical protein
MVVRTVFRATPADLENSSTGTTNVIYHARSGNHRHGAHAQNCRSERLAFRISHFAFQLLIGLPVVTAAVVCGLPWSSLAAPPAATNQAPRPAAAQEFRTLDDSWDVCRLQGKKIGYAHRLVRRGLESGREVVRTDQLLHLSLRRGHDANQQEISETAVETPDGRLIRFEFRMDMGDKPLGESGELRGDRLEIRVPGSPPATLAWKPGDGGPAAAEESLSRRPMQPGERRTLRVLDPAVNLMTEVEMTARDFESTPMPSGIRQLLRVEKVTRLPGGQKLPEETIWCDRTGEVLKTVVPGTGLELYRASKAEALETAGAGELDLLATARVTIDPPLSHPHQTRQVRYRIHLKNADPAALFTTGPTQAVRSIDPHTAEVTVYAIRPGRLDGNRKALPDPPTAADRRPNRLIQSDDPLVVKLAERAVGPEKDPWATAVALERFVRGYVTKKDFSQVFASAAEVARSREGDCTEHAVLLAALARARGIPARVAIGLVYLEGSKAFFYHMWTEVYIDGRWIPIDGTLGRGGIGAAHLKLAQSNLDGASALAAFLPVAQVFGQMQIEVLDRQ